MPNGLEGGNAADFIEYLKTEARLLHNAAKAGEPVALERLKRQCPTFQLGADLQRKHCLAAISRELGFNSWKNARDCFSEGKSTSFEAFLHPRRCHVFWNTWFATYDEAKRVQAENDGYLLVYKNQYLIVDRDYISALMAGAGVGGWEAIKRDWALGQSNEARMHLTVQIADAHIRGHKEHAASSLAN